ncbi:hypothetical protein SLA_4022 [Streptomyces laurentii]|uniref:Uncharacterized protein n=1 Tax=Streptomyces laurentii TaxID=39478 RepID=A0A160P2S9_STRLU|nr:hypothetical protein SLA_4022 [Streptomyces laurentii]
MPAPHEHDAYDATRHPGLLAWLDDRRTDFTRWAHEAAGAHPFDHSDASLDALEDLVRATYAGPEEITRQRRTPFVQGAVWYIGDVLCRRKGWVWTFEPDFDTGELPPFYGETEAPGLLDTPCVGAPGAGPGEHWYPLNTLRRLVAEDDEMGEPIDERLVGMIEGWYDEEAEEEDGENDEDGDDGDDGEGDTRT